MISAEDQLPNRASEIDEAEIFPWYGKLSLTGLSLLTLLLLAKMVAILYSGGNQVQAYTSAITALATVLLVIVTFAYVRISNNLVKESQLARIQQQTEQWKRTNHTREALYHEIKKMDPKNFIPITGDEVDRLSPTDVDELFPTIVIEGNTNNLGRLTGDEIECVIMYYNRVRILHNILKNRNADDIKNEDITSQLRLIHRARKEAIEALDSNRIGQGDTTHKSESNTATGSPRSRDRNHSGNYLAVWTLNQEESDNL